MVVAKTLKGSTGAIRDILHLKGGLTLSCGLDRFLRVFDYKTYEDLPQVFLKNKLNVLFPFEVETKEESEEEDDEDDFMEEGEDEDDFKEEDDELDSNQEQSQNESENEGFEEIEEEQEESLTEKPKKNKNKPKK
jgi:hypothetical protein